MPRHFFYCAGKEDSEVKVKRPACFESFQENNVHRRGFLVLPSPWSCHIFVSIRFSYETIMEFMSSGRSLWIFRSALSANGILWFTTQLTTVRNRSFLIKNHKSFFLSWLLQNLEKFKPAPTELGLCIRFWFDDGWLVLLLKSLEAIYTFIFYVKKWN